ncbi:MAG: hypothetical protein HQK83_20045, partial [Fibrobacteria bacterium]|nr:hypothetical protein [Fibrobacteria bacterium]
MSKTPSSKSSDPRATPDDRYAHLLSILKSYGSFALAYSGGVDSVFLAYAAHQAVGPEHYIAALAISPSLAGREQREAKKNATTLGLSFITFQSTEFKNPDFIRNDAKRCFFCKSDLFIHLKRICQERKF